MCEAPSRTGTGRRPRGRRLPTHRLAGGVVALVATVLVAGAGCGGAGHPLETASLAQPVAAPPPTGRIGIPFGPNEMAPRLYGRPYTGTKIRLEPGSALRQLRALRAAGVGATIKLVGPQRNYQNGDHTFNLERWKAAIDRFRGIDFAPFVADGTIVAHQIVSEAKAPRQWGGSVITNAQLDEMARYSKSIWPRMATLVRTDPSELEQDAAGYGRPEPGWTWRYLDAASARYLDRKTNPASFAVAAQASADRQNLSLVVGLNVLSGGDGSSGIPSPTKRKAWTMSAEEIRRYATGMLLNTRACAVELWKYFPGDAYFSDPEIATAMREMAELAGRRPGYSCAR